MSDALLGRHSPFVQGPTGVRTQILEYMKVAIPKAISYAKEEWEPENATFLPEPQQYLPYEPLKISHRTGPLFGVGVVNTQSSDVVDFSGSVELEVLTRYSVRLYLWCYTPETENNLVPDNAREETIRVRDNLSTLLRSTLYSQPGLSNPDVYSILLGTVREEFSDSAPVDNASGRHIAAVIISFDVDVEERLHNLVLGYVSGQDDPDPGVDVQADQLGDTP